MARKKEPTPRKPTAEQLDNYEERAAIMEYCGNLTREDAERKAWEEVLGPEYLRQRRLL